MTFVMNVSAETLDKAASKTRYLADITFIGMRRRVRRFRNGNIYILYI